MSSNMALGFLALLSTAAAVPHVGGHAKFHNPRAAPYPVGGWTGTNGTASALPAATGPAAGPTAIPGNTEPTTTLTETVHSTTTITSTIYGEASTPAAVVVEEVNTALPSGPGACGPEVVYVTATEKVTVTVAPNGAPTPSAVEEALPSSTAAPVEAPVETPVAYPAEPSVEAPVEYPAETPAPVETSTPAPEYTPAPEPVPSSSAVVESSAAAEPTPEPTPETPAPGNPTYSGAKRGLAYNDASLCQSFAGGNFGFAYNWGSKRETELPSNIPYVPMMHRPQLATPEEWLADVELAVSQNTNAVMGFNEPDHAQQANLSPEQACADWIKYMNPIAEKFPDVTIIGPSVTNGPAPMGLSWLDSFAEVCPNAIWHATNIHFYDIYDGAAERFKSHVGEAADKYGKPVWVTEFGLNPGAASPEQAAEFVADVISYMDGEDRCQGYAYFMVGTGENQMNDAAGLTSVGQVYASA